MRWELSYRERRIGGWLLTFSALMAFFGSWVWLQQPEAMTYDEWSLALFCAGFGLLSGRVLLATGWPPIEVDGLLERVVPSPAQRRVAGAVLLAVTLALSGVPPSAFGPGAPAEMVDTVQAASGTIHDDFEDGDVAEWTIKSDFTTFSATSSAAYEGDFGLEADTDGASRAQLEGITNKSYDNVTVWVKQKTSCSASTGASADYNNDLSSPKTVLTFEIKSGCDINVGEGGNDVDTGIDVVTDQWYKFIFHNIQYGASSDFDFKVEFPNGTVHGTYDASSLHSSEDEIDFIRITTNDDWTAHYDFFGANGASIGNPVEGYVKDLEGSDISSADLTLKDSGGSVVNSTTTDSTGYYKFTGVSDGDYTIETGASGYVNETSSTFTVSGAAKTINFTTSSNDAAALMGQLNGYVKKDGGGAIENSTVKTDGGTSEKTNSSGFYDLALTNATYDVTASKDGHKDGSKAVDVAGDTPINFSLCPKPCGSNYNQEFLVKDYTHQELDSTNSHLSSWYLQSIAGVNSKWNVEDEAYLNHNSRATHVLSNGTTYKIVLNNWHTNAHYEELGWRADRTHGLYNITIGQTPITEHRNETKLPHGVDPNGDADDDGLINVFEGGGDFDGDGIPNFEDEDSTGDGVFDGNDTSYQDHLGEIMGPTAVGSCTLLDGSEGVSVEYWDPSYSTSSFDYSVNGEDGAVFEGEKSFDQDIGYWRGCVGESVMHNASASDVENVSWEAMRGGEEVNGSSDAPRFSDIVTGPVGSTAPSSPAGQASLFGGLGIALAGLYAAGRRVGPQTTSVPAVGELGVPPLFAIGAPIVSIIALDLAGGGVISFATATVAANVGPIAGIAGIAGVGFLFYRRYIGGGG